MVTASGCKWQWDCLKQEEHDRENKLQPPDLELYRMHTESLFGLSTGISQFHLQLALPISAKKVEKHFCTEQNTYDRSCSSVGIITLVLPA